MSTEEQKSEMNLQYDPAPDAVETVQATPIDLFIPMGDHLAPFADACTVPGQLSDLNAGDYYMDPTLAGRQRWMVGKVSKPVPIKDNKAVLRFVSAEALEGYLAVLKILQEGYKLAAALESDQLRLADAVAEYDEAMRYGEDISDRKVSVISKQVAAAEAALADWHQRHPSLPPVPQYR